MGRTPLRGTLLPRQKMVEMIREKLPGVLGERRGTGDEVAARAQLLHKVPYGETLAHIVLRVQLSSRVERVGSARDHLGGQGYVGRDHEIPGPHLLDDPVIGHVEALPNLDTPDEG